MSCYGPWLLTEHLRGYAYHQRVLAKCDESFSFVLELLIKDEPTLVTVIPDACH